MSKKTKTKTVYLADHYRGKKQFPDWYIKHEATLPDTKGPTSFTWSYKQSDITENYKCDMVELSGTLYNCHHREIGRNNLVKFTLKSVLYHSPSEEKLKEIKRLEHKLSLYHSTVTSNIEAINKYGSEDENAAIRLSRLLGILTDVEARLTNCKNQIKETKKNSKKKKSAVLVLLIRMNPFKTLTQPLLLRILKMINADPSGIAQIETVKLNRAQVTNELDGFMDLYLTYDVQWHKPREFEWSTAEHFNVTVKIENVTYSRSPVTPIMLCHTGIAQTAKKISGVPQNVRVSRKAIDDYKQKMIIQATTGVFCPFQFFAPNSHEIEIAEYELRHIYQVYDLQKNVSRE